MAMITDFNLGTAVVQSSYTCDYDDYTCKTRGSEALTTRSNNAVQLVGEAGPGGG